MASGDYDRLERRQHAAWKRLRYARSEERAAAEKAYAELSALRAAYLQGLLAQLPFRWHVEHAYTPRETALYGGADHIIVDESIRVGRLRRDPGDTLARARGKFWGLSRVENDRLPTSLSDIRLAERIVGLQNG